MGLTGNTTEEKIWNFLKAKGLNDCGIAGLMGNLYAESGLRSTNLQNSYEKKLGFTDDSYTKAVDDGSYGNFVKDCAGYGLAQWTYWSRKENLLQFALSRKASIGDLETQLEFLYKELSESYKAVLNVLKSAASVLAASNVVLTQFEKPADQGSSVQQKRAGYGQTYYEKYAANNAAQTTGGNSMAVRIGHASISENGTTQGAAGDQTGKEVCVRSWYSKPWDYMAIHPDANVREKHAKAVEDACANDNIGYNWWGTNDRNSLYRLAKTVNYDLSKVGKCNCDCSSLQNVAAVASGSGAAYGSNGWTTSTMKAALKALGYKIVTEKTYLQNADYCVRGAIYVNAGSHTVCGLDNGSKANQTLSAAGISGGTSSGNTANAGESTGTVYTVVKGDTLSAIAKKYGTTYKKLAEYNGIADPNKISVGQKIKIPTGNSGSATSSSSVSQASSNKPSYVVGKVYKLLVDALRVRSGAGTNYAVKSYSQLTANAKQNAYSNGTLKKGTSVTCQAVKNVGNDIWIKIPSGWIAAYYGGDKYVG